MGRGRGAGRSALRRRAVNIRRCHALRHSAASCAASAHPQYRSGGAALDSAVANRRKTMAKKATTTAAAKKPAAPRTGGIHKPVQPSADLGAIVGPGAMPRSEVVSKVWDYIKKNNLQDAKDKRTINADAKLEKIFGKKSATMFEMNKHISGHLK
jgi:chromatin remodeling complex protein RSC6